MRATGARVVRIVPASQSVGSISLGALVISPVAAFWCCTLAMGVSRPGLTAPEVVGLMERYLALITEWHGAWSASGPREHDRCFQDRFAVSRSLLLPR